MTPAARRRAARGEGTRLRDEIIAAAEHLLAERKDADAVSIRAIAEAVGVTPPSLYLHFPDKESLLFEACATEFGRFDARMEAAAGGHDDPVAALLAIGREYVRFGLEQPEKYRFLFMVEPSFVPRGLETSSLPGMHAFARLVAVVQQVIDAGRARESDATVVAFGLWTALHGLVAARITDAGPCLMPWPDIDALVEHILSVQLHGLLAG